MKQFKILVALVLALALTMTLVGSAMAASITINRDSTWDSSAESAKATYTYYKIFDAADISGQSVVAETGAQGNDTAVAVYTISGTDAADKVAVLPSIFTAKLAADGKYYITTTETSGATIAAALKTMVDANPTLFPGTDVTSDANPVKIEGLAAAYYLIKASNGSVLAVQTLDDVTINEKNDYPTVTKEQKKAADSSYTEAKIPAEIGKYIDYQVTVHVPTNANKDIIVVDKMSAGLQYDSTTGLTYVPDISTTVADVTSTDTGYDANATWQIKIPANTVIANQGKDIVITYRALVTEAALTDTGRENEVTLKYDESNYVLKDETEYTTYYTGIEKVDGADSSVKLEGVKFELTLNGTAYNVTKSGNYYIPGGSSNEVVTDSKGLIVIRGLDNTLGDFVLTETETNTGYNLLETPKTLTLVEDNQGDAYATDNFDKIQNNKGSVLPSTGGIGTTIFYIAGLVLVLGAAAIVIARRKAEQR